MKNLCNWCLCVMEIPNGADGDEFYCCPGCYQANELFITYQSDEEINRRRHYAELTEGIPDGQDGIQ